MVSHCIPLYPAVSRVFHMTQGSAEGWGVGERKGHFSVPLPYPTPHLIEVLLTLLTGRASWSTGAVPVRLEFLTRRCSVSAVFLCKQCILQHAWRHGGGMLWHLRALLSVAACLSLLLC